MTTATDQSFEECLLVFQNLWTFAAIIPKAYEMQLLKLNFYFIYLEEQQQYNK